MKYEEAITKIDTSKLALDGREPSAPELLELLRFMEKEGYPLPDRWPAVWLALCEELRALADYHERELVRRVRMNLPTAKRPTWEQTAAIIESPITSKQGMAQRWKRLTTTVTRRHP